MKTRLFQYKNSLKTRNGKVQDRYVAVGGLLSSRINFID